MSDDDQRLGSRLEKLIYSRTVQITVAVFVLLTSAYVISPYYTTFIVGTSMEPEIMHHDVIIVSESEKPDAGDNIAVNNKNDYEPYPIVHEVVYINDTHVVTKGVNRTYRDVPAKRDNIQGEVVYSFSPPRYIKNLYAPFIPGTYDELESRYESSG